MGHEARGKTRVAPVDIAGDAVRVLSAATAGGESRRAARPSRHPAGRLQRPPGYPPAVVGKPYPGTGVVRFINLGEGWVEIDHEEIKDLMPPMQMEWSVKDRSLLKSVRVGDKVEFTVVETGGGEVLTELKRVAQEGRP